MQRDANFNFPFLTSEERDIETAPDDLGAPWERGRPARDALQARNFLEALSPIVFTLRAQMRASRAPQQTKTCAGDPAAFPAASLKKLRACGASRASRPRSRQKVAWKITTNPQVVVYC